MQRRKYEVQTDQGNWVSRQRAWQIRKRQDDPEGYKKAQHEKYLKRKEKQREYYLKWLKKFEEENGMPYHQWRKEQLEAEKEAEDADTDEE